ncbi:MAG: bifunctional oligoribonuclease/PAP phosphatase NrnA [Deltaproteobacteria bacterium]|nr:MAG: bifunctional oligoribonuclease/PAP phosphatase NrnA [Deltaproteobacteria bacterium]
MGNALTPHVPERPPDHSQHFAMREKLRKLLVTAKGHRRALVMTHDNPDPDAVASACGLAHLLTESAGVEATAVYGGIIGRAENKAMLKVLHLPVLPVSRVESQPRDLVCLVDTQPEVGNYSLATAGPPEIVIDHHPARPSSLIASFHDVGGPAGATSTLVTQYLRAAKLVPGPPLATALFYGIKSDTRDLGREYDSADVECYNWLFPLIDKPALSRIEHPSVPARYFAAYHRAYERARLYGHGEACLVDMGEVYVPEIVPEVSERLVSLEGLRWSLATGSYKGELYLSLRLNDKRVNAGKLVREICADFGGSAGGHGAMAGARIPLRGRSTELLASDVHAAFLRAFHLRPGPGTPLVPLGP